MTFGPEQRKTGNQHKAFYAKLKRLWYNVKANLFYRNSAHFLVEKKHSSLYEIDGQKKRHQTFFRAFIKTCMGTYRLFMNTWPNLYSVILNTHGQPTTCYSTPKEKNNIQTYNLTWLHPILDTNYMFIWSVAKSASFLVAREVRKTLFRHLNHKMKPTFFYGNSTKFSFMKEASCPGPVAKRSKK